MTGGTAFCTSCGAVVGEHWDICEACGAKQPVEVAASAPPPLPGARRTHTDFNSSQWMSAAGLSTDIPAATYLLWIGVAFIVVAVIYMLATAGFPPGTTTTYEVRADGSLTTSTSPDVVEAVINVSLFVVGGIFIRASRAAKNPRPR